MYCNVVKKSSIFGQRSGTKNICYNKEGKAQIKKKNGPVLEENKQGTACN